MKKIITLPLILIISLALGGAVSAITTPKQEIIEPSQIDYFSLSQPLKIPIFKNNQSTAEVELWLSLSGEKKLIEKIPHAEAEIRDRLISALTDHANSGGFDGQYTSSASLSSLRNRLKNALSNLQEGQNIEVLISSISRTEF